jgi:hypothetical protein
MLELSRTTSEAFARIEMWPTEIPVNTGQASGHRVVTERFADAIVHGGGGLVAEGPEGLNSVTIANAIMLSSFSRKPVDIPFDADEYEARLKELARTSSHAAKARQDVG